jgi:hypothetical protein
MLFDAARCCKHGGSELDPNGATGVNLQWLTSFVSLSCVFAALTNHDTERQSFWWEGEAVCRPNLRFAAKVKEENH